MKLWRYTFHPHLQRNTYVPVARLPGERTWRKVCYPLEDDKGSYVEQLQYLCQQFSNQPMEVDTHNVSSTEVWLARVVEESPLSGIGYGTPLNLPGVHLDYIIPGNCSLYGSTLLLLECYNAGMLMPECVCYKLSNTIKL